MRYYSTNLIVNILFINARYLDVVPFICAKGRQTHNNNEKKTRSLSSRNYVLSDEYQLRLLTFMEYKIYLLIISENLNSLLSKIKLKNNVFIFI